MALLGGFVGASRSIRPPDGEDAPDAGAIGLCHTGRVTALQTHIDPAPFSVDEHGVARVGGTNLALEVLLGRYNQGCSAEELHESFPHVSLADVHAAIAYYLRHRGEVDLYLREADAEVDASLQKFERDFPGHTIRVQLDD